MINAIFRPIDKWPTKLTSAADRKKARFKSGNYTQTLDLLEYELRHLEATDILIQCECQRSESFCQAKFDQVEQIRAGAA